MTFATAELVAAAALLAAGVPDASALASEMMDAAIDELIVAVVTSADAPPAVVPAAIAVDIAAAELAAIAVDVAAAELAAIAVVVAAAEVISAALVDDAAVVVSAIEDDATEDDDV
ncbi:uncharacterized protein B0H18DRAFT_1123176 [Fomitopsis serialis]|uniref:uncharacterized protein n=1 Tax=Fomitopsis serialis TaxID=139415 RepID=UPI0020086B8A|nr:uncharacterized protein B0H18DRAFT_1123176 [Neoantrodia serialis]KAH9918135.1 hypothetical protein B0H18DRAFT_1123176 [Neoantrodia serialis]